MRPPHKHNPFLFGKPVSGEHFCDREEEKARLVANLRSSNSMWLYSPRRHGKTSLIRQAMTVVEDEVACAFIDLYGVTSHESFVDAWLRGISPLLEELTGGPKRALGLLRGLLTSFSPQLSLDDAGRPVFSLGARLPAHAGGRAVADVVASPERAAAAVGRRVVIACDEFQEVAAVPGLEATLRAEVQHQTHTSYVFAGSRRSLLHAMFTDQRRPFFEFGEHMTLGRISPHELHAYLGRRFEASDVQVPEGVITDLVAAADGHPHYTQYFAAQAWELAVAAVVTEAELRRGWRERVVQSQDPVLSMVHDSLSAGQRRVLRHLAAHGSAGIFSQAVRSEAGLGSSSTVASAMEALVAKDMLRRVEGGSYRFVNPAFALWLVEGRRDR